MNTIVNAKNIETTANLIANGIILFKDGSSVVGPREIATYLLEVGQAGAEGYVQGQKVVRAQTISLGRIVLIAGVVYAAWTITDALLARAYRKQKTEELVQLRNKLWKETIQKQKTEEGTYKE